MWICGLRMADVYKYLILMLQVDINSKFLKLDPVSPVNIVLLPKVSNLKTEIFRNR